jgi:hypothetical protein
VHPHVWTAERCRGQTANRVVWGQRAKIRTETRGRDRDLRWVETMGQVLKRRQGGTAAASPLADGPMAQVIRSLDGESETLIRAQIPFDGGMVTVNWTMPLAELRARFGHGSELERRGRDWETSEVAQAVGDSPGHLKRRLRVEPDLREAGGVYRKQREVDGKPVEYGSYLFPEHRIPAFLAAYRGSCARLNDGTARDPGEAATEPPTPTPPAEDPTDDALPLNLDAWKKEFRND